MDSSRRSGMPSGSFVSETTYNGDYKFVKQALSLRFHDYISFVVETPHKVVPRSFPHYSLHTSPHRILKFEKSTLGFGPTGGEYERLERRKNTSCQAKTAEKTRSDCMEGINGTAKSKSRSEGKKEERDENSFESKDIEITENNNDTVLKRFSSENASKELVYKMATEGIYKTTARRAGEESALPVRARPMVLPKILGTNEDRELFHSVYKRTGTWKTKTVPKYWEHCQERPIYENPKKYRPCRLESSTTNPKLLRWRSPLETERMILPNVKTPEMQQLTIPADLHIRPAPGYGGFVPKLPVIPGRARDPRLGLSSSATTYRQPLPSRELKILEHAHKGPLSKLVTTTSPCNPFKNITVCPDHLFVY